MLQSMAASLTAAVRRGYDVARRCDGYGGHGCCDHGGDTTLALEALYNRTAHFSAAVYTFRLCPLLLFRLFLLTGIFVLFTLLVGLQGIYSRCPRGVQSVPAAVEFRAHGSKKNPRSISGMSASWLTPDLYEAKAIVSRSSTVPLSTVIPKQSAGITSHTWPGGTN